MHEKANCTVSMRNVTICQISSRTFGKILVTKSSIYERLVNEADVSDDKLDFHCLH